MLKHSVETVWAAETCFIGNFLNRSSAIGQQFDCPHNPQIMVKEWMPNVSIQELYAQVTTQTLLTSLKELFGVVCIIGTAFLVVLVGQKLWRKLLALVRMHLQKSFHVIKNSNPPA